MSDYNPAKHDVQKLDTKSPKHSEDLARSQLAFIIIMISAGLILVFGLISIGVAFWFNDGSCSVGTSDCTEPTQSIAVEMASNFINALLPMLSAWVGAVLAYYFVNQANKEANRNTLELLNRRSFSETVKQVPITSVMRIFPQIDPVIVKLNDNGEIITPISKILEIFDNQGRTRVPIFIPQDGRKRLVLRYVLHESTVYEWLARKHDGQRALNTITIQELVNDPSTRKRWDITVGHLSIDATLSDAKQIMDANPRIQDVAVTVTGEPYGEFAGWLTNVDVLRHCVAGASSLDEKD